MSIDRFVLAFAGAMVLVSLPLGHFVSPDWYWLSTFVGASRRQSAVTGGCPLALILRKAGVRSGAAF
jgi:hypothetical protein